MVRWGLVQPPHIIDTPTSSKAGWAGLGWACTNMGTPICSRELCCRVPGELEGVIERALASSRTGFEPCSMPSTDNMFTALVTAELPHQLGDLDSSPSFPRVSVFSSEQYR